MSLSIRPAIEADLSLIVSFIRDLAEYEQLAHEVTVTEDVLRASLFGEKPYAEVIFAEVEGQPAGFALFFHNFSTFLGKPGLYLEDLFVRPDYRGHGIGQALLNYLQDLALSRGCGRLEWWVLDWNESAIGFYKKLGAVPMDEWTVFRLTEDVMRQNRAVQNQDVMEGVS
jgi:GNAT superfamily N-acetyltransferase